MLVGVYGARFLKHFLAYAKEDSRHTPLSRRRRLSNAAGDDARSAACLSLFRRYCGLAMLT